MTDATCYESHLRFPTDMKLLWESVEWLHRQIIGQCSELHIRRPRNKFDDVSRVYLSYCKKRRRKTSRTRMLKRRLLHLLEKLLLQIDEIRKVHGSELSHTSDYQRRLAIMLIVSSKRKPPLKWNLSTTGNLRCFKLYRTHVNINSVQSKLILGRYTLYIANS